MTLGSILHYAYVKDFVLVHVPWSKLVMMNYDFVLAILEE